MTEKLIEAIRNSRRTVVLTGAGISTLSGIPDFRGKGGLYSHLDAEEVFGIEAFHRDPSCFYSAMKEIIYGLKTITPSIVHRELARLEGKGLVNWVLTQNIDLLHHHAGSKNVIELHGSPLRNTCMECGAVYTYNWVAGEVKRGLVPRCDGCGGVVKPDITFYGEMLDQEALNRATLESSQADLMLVLGSSLAVYPVANLPAETLRNGGKLAIVNNQPTPYDDEAICLYPDLEEAFNAIASTL